MTGATSPLPKIKKAHQVCHRVALGPVEVDVGTLAGAVAEVQQHRGDRVGHRRAVHPQDAVAVPLLAGHLQPGLELRRVGHRDLQEQHRVVGRELVAQALLVRLLEVLQQVTGMRFVGDDADLAGGGRRLEEAAGGRVQVDLGDAELGGPGDP